MSVVHALVGVLGALALAAGASTPIASASSVTATAPAATATATADDGLAQRFVSAGSCAGGPHFRVVFHNVGGEDPGVRADVTVRQAGRRADWQFNTMATTTFADGQSVTGIGDFGQVRSDRKGMLRLNAGTPSGAHHSIEFTMSRSDGPGHCRVLVAG